MAEGGQTSRPGCVANVAEHKVKGYRNVFVALKEPGTPPGDISADQMDTVADLADRYSFGLIRSTHHQNCC